MSWVLELKIGDKIKHREVEEGVLTLGREGCDLNIDDTRISKHHCSFYLHSDHLTLVDNSSTNGTFVNGKKIGKKDLSHMDRIIVGRTHIRVINKEQA